MAKTKISEFSATANSNTDINSINIAEGCAPSNINDAIRELMAELKDFQAGTKGDSFNGPVGSTTAAAGAFTTLSASSTVSGTGFSTYLASPPAIGGTAPAAGSFTTLSSTGNTTLGDAVGDTITINGTATFANANPTLSAGTANGVLYLNGSKVATSGSALTFDGTNLGLGVTPSAWSSGKVLEIGNTGNSVWGNSTANFYLTENAYYNGGWKYASSNGAATYQMLTNSHIWSIAASGTAGNAITFTQAMTLDASGNLGVGTTSPVFSDGSGVHLQRAGVATYRTYNSSSTAAGEFRADATGTAIDCRGLEVFRVLTGGSERARITSGGDFVVGKAATGVGTQGFGVYSTGDFEANAGNNPAGYLNRTNDGTILSIRRSGTTVGTISVTTTATAYNTSSDYRLKENIQPMTGALAKVQALKPCTYNWKADGSEGEGFIAHELAEVAPQAVTGEKDAVDADGNPVYQGIDTSFLVATLTAALQEAVAEINSLKARLDVANL